MSFAKRWSAIGKKILLWVVRRIREYAREKTTPDAIRALYRYAVLICFQEVIIKNDCPLSMVHFSLAMRHEGRLNSFLADVFCRERFERVRKLPLNEIEGLHCSSERNPTYRLKISDMFKCMARRHRSSIF